ncbi:hypothetical protein CSQ85_12915 [Bifidobacterium rousetti]|nr:hypothetical protein CSQ85_12915 [Bifidobacterium rousetti]
MRDGVHIYSTDDNEQKIAQRNGWKVEGVAFYAASVTAPKATAVHRLRNLSNGQYLLSSDPNEISTLTARTWTDEGVAFYAPQGASAPVYRFNKGEHLYTADENEYKVNTTKGGWSADGVLLYAALAETK